MSALGSSVINKSGKKFAPKAPVRRPAATAISSPQAIAGASTRAFQASQPSQSQSLQPPKSPPIVPVTFEDTNTVANPSVSSIQPSDGNNSQKHTAASGTPVVDQSSIQTPGTSITVPDSSELTRVVFQYEQSNQSNTYNPNPSTPGEQTRIEQSSQESTQARNDKSTPDIRSGPVHEDAPAAKRRKVTNSETENTSGVGTSRVNATCRPSADFGTRNASATGSSSTSNAQQGSAPPKNVARKPPVKSRRNRRTEATAARGVAEATSGSGRGVKLVKRSAKSRNPRPPANAQRRQRLEDVAAEIVADAVEGTRGRRKGRRGIRGRETTPEEAEDDVIEPGTIKMADLCKDSGRGKKSDMLKALQEHDREEFAKRKQKELQELVNTAEPSDPATASDGVVSSATRNNSGQAGEESVERREDIVRQVAGTLLDQHGQIVIDTASLRMNRHAQAAIEREAEQQEAIVENDLSRPAVNYGTYMKKETVNAWPESLTDEFYEALRMFGTDFGMIGKMLRKTRRAVKLKFNREEKQDPNRIKETLLGERIPVDVEEYSRRAGEEIKELDEHERMMEEDRKEIEGHAAEERRAREEQDRLRNEAIEKERAAVPEDSSGKENREAGPKKKGKGKGKKVDGDKRRGRNTKGEMQQVQ
ncbi:MAG: hypothetical protein LQ352_000364 [Teloschistes flavicans]|nr:MAG: hypothetical protein LQ352_000364 [Teloschistes flavicans]